MPVMLITGRHIDDPALIENKRDSSYIVLMLSGAHEKLDTRYS